MSEVPVGKLSALTLCTCRVPRGGVRCMEPWTHEETDALRCQDMSRYTYSHKVKGKPTLETERTEARFPAQYRTRVHPRRGGRSPRPASPATVRAPCSVRGTDTRARVGAGGVTGPYHRPLIL